jgi:very-short-patch-repair endonuclease
MDASFGDSTVSAHGIRVIRFENKMIFEDIERVLDIIRSHFGCAKRENHPVAQSGDTPPL